MLNNTDTTNSTVSETTNAYDEMIKTAGNFRKKVRNIAIMVVIGEVAVVTGLCIGAYFLGRASK